MDFGNIDVPKSIRSTSLAWDLIPFLEEDFFPQETPASTLKIYNGSAFITASLQRYNGSSWQPCTIKVFLNPAWV